MGDAKIFRGEESPLKKDETMSRVNIILCNVYIFFKGAILNINIKRHNNNSSKQETSAFKNTSTVCLETVADMGFMCSYVD